MMTTRNARCAALDTHVLKYLRDKGVPDVPRQTPAAGPTYERLEQAFLGFADDVGVSPAILDISVWEDYRNRGRAAPA